MQILEVYVAWVKGNPLLSAAIQFAILGTLGEVISNVVRTRRIEWPFGVLTTLLKMVAWAVLGVLIKYGFAGCKGAVAALLDHGLLPQQLGEGIGWAASVSVTANLFFGPQMMAFHRLEDNLIDRKWDFTGIQKAWATLIWFWIPAHTVTFMMPPDYQIGLAAAWSLVLGLIMGLTNKVKKQ
ncbi:MAG: hypothetical protein FJ109_01265 [Deltaproteobacteria bacterium]|nr:hypothetical protein [Deltaproteobacteria bacterium]